MSVVAVIPARGGSKGVPRKNVRELGGEPLIVHTIRSALESKAFDAVIVSSEDAEILRIAKARGAHCVQRPVDLATDEAGSIPVVVHALRWYEETMETQCGFVAMLHCTTPFCGSENMKNAVEQLRNAPEDVENIISVCEAHRSPYFNMLERDGNGRVSLSKPSPSGSSLLCRQDSPSCFDINGAIYVWRREAIAADPILLYPHTILYEMPARESLDIDTEFDFELAELLMSQKIKDMGRVS